MENRKYRWYYCDAICGYEDNYSEAFESLSVYCPWINSVESISIVSPDGKDEYFYPSQKEANEDETGTYTPSIFEIEIE